mmetsp:Transcript_46567/g.108759  ORF Transcript_46567/g.108759 Transcript_46567/m.108759 type:complete len:382 (+) Transcript_46567:594-1739(+)
MALLVVGRRRGCSGHRLRRLVVAVAVLVLLPERHRGLFHRLGHQALEVLVFLDGFHLPLPGFLRLTAFDPGLLDLLLHPSPLRCVRGFLGLSLQTLQLLLCSLHLLPGGLHALLRLLHHLVGEGRYQLPWVRDECLHDVHLAVVTSDPREWLPVFGIWIVHEKDPVGIVSNEVVDVFEPPIQFRLALNPRPSLFPLRHILAGVCNHHVEIQKTFCAPKVLRGVDEPGNGVIRDAAVAHDEEHGIYAVGRRQRCVADARNHLVLVQLCVSEANCIEHHQRPVGGFVLQHRPRVGNGSRVVPGEEMIVACQEVSESALARPGHPKHHDSKAFTGWQLRLRRTQGQGLGEYGGGLGAQHLQLLLHSATCHPHGSTAPHFCGEAR